MSGRVYLDEIEEGARYRSARRTVTEADIVNFAGLSGDFNALHMDEVFGANETPFGTRVAHGLLTVSIGSGLRSAIDDWHILAYLECSRRFLGPVRAGDTVHVESRVSGKRGSERNSDRGVVTLEIEVKKQDGTTVQAGEDILLVGREEGV